MESWVQGQDVKIILPVPFLRGAVSVKGLNYDQMCALCSVSVTTGLQPAHGMKATSSGLQGEDRHF